MARVRNRSRKVNRSRNRSKRVNRKVNRSRNRSIRVNRKVNRSRNKSIRMNRKVNRKVNRTKRVNRRKQRDGGSAPDEGKDNPSSSALTTDEARLEALRDIPKLLWGKKTL